MNYSQLIESVIELSYQAGDAILNVYHQADFATRIKSDDSPLTEADLASHKIIVAGLELLTPEIPVLSEESKAITFAERESWQTYWLVDPLDGTKEFISRNNDFTTNIALIVNNRPVLGVIYVPVDKVVYFASKGHGAFKQQAPQPATAISVRQVPEEQGAKHYKVVASRRHGVEQVAELCKKMPHYELVNRGSSLKMCQIAEGSADLYPRLAPTSEWDTAAAQIIVEEAGGALVTLDFVPLNYNTKDSLLNPHFYTLGSSQENWQTLLGD